METLYKSIYWRNALWLGGKLSSARKNGVNDWNFTVIVTYTSSIFQSSSKYHPGTTNCSQNNIQ